MIRTGRKIAIIVLPSLTAASGLFLHFYHDAVWLDWVNNQSFLVKNVLKIGEDLFCIHNMDYG